MPACWAAWPPIRLSPAHPGPLQQPDVANCRGMSAYDALRATPISSSDITGPRLPCPTGYTATGLPSGRMPGPSLCAHKRRLPSQGRRYSGFNLFDPDDEKLLCAIVRGEFNITAGAAEEQRRNQRNGLGAGLNDHGFPASPATPQSDAIQERFRYDELKR